MNKGTKMAVAGLLGASLLATAPAALANDADVIRRGSCSAASDWKLKLSPENGRIEVEYEVDQNKVGDTWKVRLFHNGDRIFRGKRTTKGPSGSFTVRVVTDNAPGTDHVRAQARNLSTDERCGGSASI
jgi:hypothetical protein